jgi:hypothetical protein
LSAHSTPVVTIKRDAVATRLTQAVVQSIGAPVAPEVVAAIQRELSVSLAERDTEVASARSESQLLLSELTDARRVIARLAESLGPAKAQQILGDASSSSSGGPANQPMPLTSDTLRRHNKDKPATLARGKPTVLSRRHDPLRVYDRSYVVALEKELLDTREELDDLKTAIDETEATINTLKTKFPHLQSANINLGSKLKTDDDGAADAELPPGAPNDDDDAASATLEAFVVWRATMAQDQQQFNAALQRPMPAVDSFAVADSSAPEFAAMPVPAADENDSDSDEQPPPPQDGDASMRFVPLSQMMARPVPSSPPAASPFDVIAPAKPKRSVNPPPTANAASASPEVGSPSSPRPTPPPPRAAQPTPTVPPKSPPVSPRVPRNNKPLPQLPPKSRTSTTQHPNAPASIDEDKTPSDRVEPSEDSDSVRVSQRQTKPLPEFNSTDLELARQAARKPLPVAGHSNSAAAAAAVAATMPSSPVSSAAAATALPVAKKPPMPTVARPALRVNLPTGAANVAVPGPASPGSPSKRAPPTLTLPALPGIPQGQPGVYDLVPTTSQMEAALVENAAIDALVPPTEYGKIPSFVDEQQQQQQENAETTEEIGADEVN